jgi:4'-phosphopantetheinyl transferase
VWCVRPGSRAFRHADGIRLQEDETHAIAELAKHGGPRHNVQMARLTRALCRAALTAVCPQVTPERWPLARRASGQRYIATWPAQLTARPDFSIAHTQGMVVCAVCRQGETVRVGVDVESVVRTAQMLRIARRYFAPTEASYLAALTDTARPQAFFRLWTLKEAYLKAYGRGIARLSPQMAFALTAQGRARYVGPRAGGTERVYARTRLQGDWCFGLVVAATCAGPMQAPRAIWHTSWPDIRPA